MKLIDRLVSIDTDHLILNNTNYKIFGEVRKKLAERWKINVNWLDGRDEKFKLGQRLVKPVILSSTPIKILGVMRFGVTVAVSASCHFQRTICI